MGHFQSEDDVYDDDDDVYDDDGDGITTTYDDDNHDDVPGNEAADSLAKEGTTKEQVVRSTGYPGVKIILKAKQHSKWWIEHPGTTRLTPTRF